MAEYLHASASPYGLVLFDTATLSGSMSPDQAEQWSAALRVAAARARAILAAREAQKTDLPVVTERSMLPSVPFNSQIPLTGGGNLLIEREVAGPNARLTLTDHMGVSTDAIVTSDPAGCTGELEAIGFASQAFANSPESDYGIVLASGGRFRCVFVTPHIELHLETPGAAVPLVVARCSYDNAQLHRAVFQVKQIIAP
jgi:hypothetical protein